MAGERLLGDLVGRIRIDSKPGLDQADRDVRGATDRMGGHFRQLAGIAGAAFAGVQVVSFFKDSIAEAREAAEVGKITANTIKATGAAANVTADAVGNLAGRLSAKTGIDDEAIQKGSNLILTFKNIRNEAGKGNKVFDQATQAALDLSASGFGSIEGASVMLGKALNDPIKGISALGRAGVTFTDQQKAQIKAMQESGDMLGAQKIILQEINAQVGGNAAAAADPMKKLGVAVGNLKESLGTALLPIISSVATVLADKLPGAINKTMGVARQLFNIFARRDFVSGPFGEDSKIVDIAFKIRDALAAVIRVVSDIVGKFIEFAKNNPGPVLGALATIVGGVLVGALVALGGAIVAALSPFVLITAAVAALVGGIIYAWQNFETFRNIVTTVMTTVQGVISGALGLIQGAWRLFGDDIKTYVSGLWTIISGIFQGGVDIIKGIFDVFAGIFTGDWSRVWEGVKGIVSGAVGAIGGILSGLPGILRGLVGAFFSAAGALGGAILDGISSGLSKTASFVKDVAKGILNALINFTNDRIINGINEGLKISWDPPGPIGKITLDPPNIPRIPNFHMGGIVPGMPGEEVFAKLKAGERVSTEQQQAFDRMGGQIIIQPQTADLDEFALMRVLSRIERGLI